MNRPVTTSWSRGRRAVKLAIATLAMFGLMSAPCALTGPTDGIGADGYKRLTDSCRQCYDAAGRLVTECRHR